MEDFHALIVAGSGPYHAPAPSVIGTVASRQFAHVTRALAPRFGTGLSTGLVNTGNIPSGGHV